MVDIEVGDEVRIFDVNSASRRQARRNGEFDEGAPATVEKVGRKLVTLREGNSSWTRQFRLDTGLVNDNYGHAWFRTLADHERDRRQYEALKVLAEHRITIEPQARLTMEQIEALADVARRF